MKTGIFVTGTDTGVGKTFTAALLCQVAHLLELPVRYFKPVQTGEESDSAFIQNFTDLTSNHILSPVYSLKAPQAPSRAAQLEGITIDLNRITSHFAEASDGFYIVEGAGGILVPLTKTHTIRDLLYQLNFPTIIVARTALGTINHTLLTIEALQKANLSILGILLIGPKDDGLQDCLQTYTDVPIMSDLPWLPGMHATHIKKVAEMLKDTSCFQEIFHNAQSYRSPKT